MTIRMFTRMPLGLALFGLVTSISLLFMGGHSTSVDEETYLTSLRSFLRGRSELDLTQVALGSISGTTGRNGQLTSYYGFGTILFNLPMYVVGKIFALPVNSDSKEQVLRLFFYSTNSIALGLTALCIFKTCTMAGISQKAGVWTALTYSFCTYALQTASGGFAEPMTAMFLLWAVYFASNARSTTRALFLCGLFLGCAVLMRPSSIMFIPLFAVYLLFVRNSIPRTSRMVYTALGGAIPVAIFFTTNWWRFGGPLETGYSTIPFNVPLYEGLFGQFASPGKGLVWFAPLTLLAFATLGRSFRSHRSLMMLLWSCVAINAVFFGRFEVWNGDVAYGPRYMGIVLPMVAVLAGLGSDHLTKWGRLSFSLAGLPASIGGALVYFNASNWHYVKEITQKIGRAAVNTDGSYDYVAMRPYGWFVPRFSQITYHLRSIDDAFRNSWEMALGANSPNIFRSGNKLGMGWYSKAIRLDTWWAYWLETNAPRLFLLGVPVLLAVMGLCVYSVWKSTSIDAAETTWP